MAMDREDRLKALDAAISQIEKQYGKGAVMKLGDPSSTMNIETTPTGSLALDIALGLGGIPKGRVIEVYGPESSGKTTLTLHMIAEVQRRGGIATYQSRKTIEKALVVYGLHFYLLKGESLNMDGSMPSGILPSEMATIESTILSRASRILLPSIIFIIIFKSADTSIWKSVFPGMPGSSKFITIWKPNGAP